MFSPDIVGSDAFIDMPTSSRELYFQLGMYADDDGFVNPRKIMRMIGASDDDLRVLLTKRFLLKFETGVVVIKHWLIHNMIRRDRYKPTNYVGERKLIAVKSNRAYTEATNSPELATSGQPSGNHGVSQVRLGKVRLEGDSDGKAVTQDFSLGDAITELENSSHRQYNVIALYLSERLPDIQSKKQMDVTVKRHLKPAMQLKVFSDDQIVTGFGLAKKMTAEWTLETVVKALTK